MRRDALARRRPHCPATSPRPPGTRWWRTGLVAGVSLLAAACLSTAAAPVRTDAARCVLDEGLAGTWASRRMTQLGPASLRLSFDCRCGYRARTALLFGVHREAGGYTAAAGTLTLSRASGAPTTWSYDVDGERLTLVENGETHAWRRVRHEACAPAAGR